MSKKLTAAAKPESIDHLEERFSALWNRCLYDGLRSNAGSVYQEIAFFYSEPHRAYHTLNHLAQCFQQLDLAANLLRNRDAVEMGLWFHDIIYAPGSSTNELESAKLFASRASHCLSPDFVSEVYNLIMVTTHREIPIANDAIYVSDIDLSSLGLPWECFLEDANNLRAEQAQLPDHIYYPRHVRFLRFLLARPRIFCSDLFFSRYENVARQNITRFVDALTEKGDVE
jgi:predicted metal-dependent HD superfamily phosphohydrolase